MGDEELFFPRSVTTSEVYPAEWPIRVVSGTESLMGIHNKVVVLVAGAVWLPEVGTVSQVVFDSDVFSVKGKQFTRDVCNTEVFYIAADKETMLR